MLRSHLETERRERETVSEFPRSVEQAVTSKKIRIKVRFDYKGLPRPAKFFFGGKGSREMAEELRQQQSAMWRNIPLQGVHIDDVEYFELYSVYDEIEEDLISYAPMELKVTVDSLEDCLRFICREEFRRVEILDPAGISLSSSDLERLFFKFSETLRQRLRDQELK